MLVLTMHSNHIIDPFKRLQTASRQVIKIYVLKQPPSLLTITILKTKIKEIKHRLLHSIVGYDFHTPSSYYPCPQPKSIVGEQNENKLVMRGK